MSLRTKIVYAYDFEGYFKGERLAQQHPTDKNRWIIPENTVEEPVDSEKLKTHFAKHVNGSWVYEEKPKTANDFVGVIVSHQSQTPHDIELRSLLQELVNKDQDHYKVIRGPEEEGLWWSVEAIPEPTAEELELKEKESRISKLKSNLSSTDYVVIKIAEGAASQSEYAEVIASREQWRSEINELEVRVAELKEIMK